MRAILDGNYLPENPYNTIYRLLMPDAMLMNSIHFYDRSKSRLKKINSNINSLAVQRNQTKPSNSTETQAWMEEILTKRVQIAEKQFFIGSKMARYIHPNALYVIWNEIFTKPRLSTINQLMAKHKLVSYFLSMGGPALLLLEGVSSYSENNQSVKMSLKINQPLSLNSYASQSMLELGYFITVTTDQPSFILTNFCNFMIEESLQEMQNNSNETYMFLTKLSVGINDKEAIVEWSTSQLIHEKARIVKEIVKMLLTEKCELNTYYYVKASKKVSASLSEDYFTLTKTYILISPFSDTHQMNSTKRSSKQLTSPTLTIYTPTPLSFMFEHFFIVPHYYEALDKAYGLNSIKNEHIFMEYRNEKFKKVLNDIKVHSLISASRQLFFLSLYDMSLNPMSLQNVIDALNLIINNPLNVLSRTIHQLKVCKIILNPTASSLTLNSENHLFQTLQTIETMFYEYEKESDCPYPEIYVAFETLRKILSVLLTRQKFRVNIIKLLLDYVILCLRGVLNSFLGIAWSLTDTLHFYIIELDKSLGNQLSKSTIEQIVTYDDYLSNIKSLPHRAICIPEEIKRYQQQLGTTENQTRDLIYTKYLQHYQIYSHIFEFYWQLVEGKKLHYPLSKLIEVLKTQAIQNQAQIMQKEILRLKQNKKNSRGQNRVTINRINGIEIYQMLKGVNNQFTFYSFSQNSLHESALNEYGKFYEKFLTYFQQNLENFPSLIGQAKFIISLKNLPFLNDFSEQSSGIYITTLYADLIIRKQMKKQELITILYNHLSQFMESVDKDEIGVLGLYSSWRNLGNASIVYHGDSDEIYGQTSFESTSFVKFDYKRKTPFEQFYKFIENCITSGKQIQVRLIYKDQKIIQSCNVTFNVFFYQGQNLSLNSMGEKADDFLKPLIEIGNWEDRVFYGNKDIIEWGVINKVADKKLGSIKKKEKKPSSIESISPTKSKERASQITLNSMKKILDEQEVVIEQLILEQDEIPNPTDQVTLLTLRLISPTYTNLEQSHHHLLTLLYLLTYIKHDRRNRFEFSFIMDQVSLIEYYLMEHCLKSDKFIFLEGLVVEVTNLLAAIKGYLRQREDNLGTEWEILWVEKIVCRITGLVKMLMVNVTAQIKKYSLKNKRAQI